MKYGRLSFLVILLTSTIPEAVIITRLWHPFYQEMEFIFQPLKFQQVCVTLLKVMPKSCKANFHLALLGHLLLELSCDSVKKSKLAHTKRPQRVWCSCQQPSWQSSQQLDTRVKTPLDDSCPEVFKPSQPFSYPAKASVIAVPRQAIWAMSCSNSYLSCPMSRTPDILCH